MGTGALYVTDVTTELKLQLRGITPELESPQSMPLFIYASLFFFLTCMRHIIINNQPCCTRTFYWQVGRCTAASSEMVNYYDELEIEDFAWDPVAKLYHYPCPCGDRFEISKSQLRDGEEIAICPSCSLIVRVVYDYVSRLNRHCGCISGGEDELTNTA